MEGKRKHSGDHGEGVKEGANGRTGNRSAESQEELLDVLDRIATSLERIESHLAPRPKRDVLGVNTPPPTYLMGRIGKI